MKSSYFNFFKYITYILLTFALYCSLINGLSMDENFHHISGQVRYIYLKNLGDFDKYKKIYALDYYPGFNDTINYVLYKIISAVIGSKFLVEIKHFINYVFSSFGILGLYFVNKKIFNKDIAIISCALALFNPFFFGNIGINPKDPIIFFAFIWSIYFLLQYLDNIQDKRFSYLFYLSFFLGLGTSIRLSFVSILIPIFFSSLIYIWIKTKDFKKVILDFILLSTIAFVITISCWPHFLDGNYNIIFETLGKSSNWNIDKLFGILNGEFYEIQNTPKDYFLTIFIHRMPIYINILFLFGIYLSISKNGFFKNNTNSNFINFFCHLMALILFPIFLLIIVGANLYDNFRLVLFILPLISTVCAIGLYYIIFNFPVFKISTKIINLSVLLFFIIFLFRFLLLTPYQQSYVNYLNSPIYSDAKDKFEYDYMATSYKELLKKIKKKYGYKNTKNLKIGMCNGTTLTHGYYWPLILGNNNTYKYPHIADYIVMTNRSLDQHLHYLIIDNVNYIDERKINCTKKYSGKDLIVVERMGLVLSTFRKLDK